MNKKYTKSIQKLTKKANFLVIFFWKCVTELNSIFRLFTDTMSTLCLGQLFMPSHSNHVDGESDIDGEDAEDNLVESDEDDNDMMPEKPQNQFLLMIALRV